jgi:lambda repressor-like predicted transcriptional regulator
MQPDRAFVTHGCYRLGMAEPRMLTHDSKTLSIRAWARELGIHEATIRSRLRVGWPLATALSTGPDYIPAAADSAEPAPFTGTWATDVLTGDLALVNEINPGVWRCLCICGGLRFCSVSELEAGPSHDADLCLRRRQGPSGNGYGRCRRTRFSWSAMIARCYDKTNGAYYKYGARGKRVCVRWRLSLAAFEEDVGQRTSTELSIERTNNERGYFPGNCRWATRGEQARNTVRTRMVEYQGQTKCVADWAAEYGIDSGTVYSRIDRGWSLERALTTPARAPALLTHSGKTQTVAAWAREVGLEPSTLRKRLDSGWPAGQALYQPAGKPRG